jgi:hypothetical protein
MTVTKHCEMTLKQILFVVWVLSTPTERKSFHCKKQQTDTTVMFRGNVGSSKKETKSTI